MDKASFSAVWGIPFCASETGYEKRDATRRKVIVTSYPPITVFYKQARNSHEFR